MMLLIYSILEVQQYQQSQQFEGMFKGVKERWLLITAYIPRYYVFQYVATNNVKYLDGHLAKQLIETGILKHDDEKCFWTDTYYSSKEKMETIYGEHGLKIIDHFAQDGLSPLLSQKID